MRRLSCLSIEPAAISRRCGRCWTRQTSQTRPNHQSPDQPPKISRPATPRSTRSDSRVVSSPTPESCKLPPPKTARTSSQSADTTSITTAIARKAKVRTTQAIVAHNSRSHRRFIGEHYNSSRRFREGPKSNRSGERELFSAERTKHMLPDLNLRFRLALFPTTGAIKDNHIPLCNWRLAMNLL